MSMQYVRDNYNVPAKRCGEVLYVDFEGGHHYGTITSADGQYLLVRFDGDRTPSICHPNDLEYIGGESDAR